MVQEILPQVINKEEYLNEENQYTNKNYVTDKDTIRLKSDDIFSVLDSDILEIEDDI